MSFSVYAEESMSLLDRREQQSGFDEPEAAERVDEFIIKASTEGKRKVSRRSHGEQRRAIRKLFFSLSSSPNRAREFACDRDESSPLSMFGESPALVTYVGVIDWFGMSIDLDAAFPFHPLRDIY